MTCKPAAERDSVTIVSTAQAQVIGPEAGTGAETGTETGGEIGTGAETAAGAGPAGQDRDAVSAGPAGRRI